MPEQQEPDTNLQLARLPRRLRILRNPVAIVLATYFAYYTLGQVLLGNSLVILFLDTQELRSLRPWDEAGACGKFSGWLDLDVILCRLLYPKEAILVFLVPFSILALLTWLIHSVAARRFLGVVSRRQRWHLILSMYLVATTSLIMGFAKLPQDILFTGPIHGFHPLGPLLREVCRFIAPLIFWHLIGKFEIPYLHDGKDV
jgi:hypothetical protein